MSSTATLTQDNKEKLKVNRLALVGNPNSGKTSLFNLLTGLNQKVGNYPGVTIEKKMGMARLNDGSPIQIIDLPGTYSLKPRSEDEKIVAEVLRDSEHQDYPDAVAVTADMTNLERNLLLFSQIYDLGIPVVLVLTMPDVARKEGLTVDVEKLSQMLNHVPIVVVNNRTGQGQQQLKELLANFPGNRSQERFYIPGKTMVAKQKVSQTEVSERFMHIKRVLSFCVSKEEKKKKVSAFTRKLDQALTHRIFGYLIFFGILAVIFQAIFSLASYPMDLIDHGFGSLSSWITRMMPEGPLAALIAEGLIPGLGGIAIFIPQIAILFGFLAILEETGYMARVVFIMDKVMRKFGLNGRSVVPLMSGMACAIPAILATRSIDNWKERLITILVTPFMSCSARLPVYTLMISLLIQPTYLLGFINVQGLALLVMYLIGIGTALVASVILNTIIRVQSKGFLIMELPLYKWPRWSNVGLTMYQKSRTFVLEAGKIILAISIVLWVLGSFGPEVQNDKMVGLVEKTEELDKSYIGRFGKAIEPAIEPLGFDWKIGIAVLTSFAAREVFVSTVATIYSVQNDASNETIIQRLQKEKRPDGSPVFNSATSVSLLMFYAFAMQCMSTFAVVYRETRTWKWPLIQAVGMTVMAYLVSLITYQIMTL